MGTFMDTCVGEPSNANGTSVPVGEASSCHDNRDHEGQLDKFTRLLRDLECELYSGCQKYSKLSFLVKLLHIKLINGWSNKSFNMVLELFKDTLPDGEMLPKSHYEAKKVLRDLGLGCVNTCT